MLNLGLDTIFNWQTMLRLCIGLMFNLQVAAISIVITTVLGVFIGVLRSLDYRLLNLVFRLYLEILRILPTLVLLFVLYFTIPGLLGWNISGVWVGVLAFSIWGVAEMSDIMRSAIIALPRHQIESTKALGLSRWQSYAYVLLPQALLQALPPSINLFARIIMSTSLLVLIGVRDVIKVGKEIIEFNSLSNDLAPFWIYGLILLLFFVICYSVSLVAKRLELRLAAKGY